MISTRAVVAAVMMLASSVGVAHTLHCGPLQKAFLASPTKANYLNLSAVPPCVLMRSPSLSHNLNKLRSLVAEGNIWAAKYLAQNIRTQDGGELEDSLVALGEFSEQNMAEFLNLVRSKELTNKEMQDALTMLPLSDSDNGQLQLEIMEKRAALVRAVKAKELYHEKNLAIRYIVDFRNEIQQHLGD